MPMACDAKVGCVQYPFLASGIEGWDNPPDLAQLFKQGDKVLGLDFLFAIKGQTPDVLDENTRPGKLQCCGDGDGQEACPRPADAPTALGEVLARGAQQDDL